MQDFLPILEHQNGLLASFDILKSKYEKVQTKILKIMERTDAKVK
ncbi:hypothetical protein MNB_SV-6-1549 [hydrothermal vent metagenome]|uniref:Uncharacterized protein n=1 Tax=hydrothermal vent metagenome TaxID=652676 RepID=A0A1W1CF64_9ZZZZ